MAKDNEFSPVKPFKFWTQMALPTVYSDALSYMEDIGKIASVLNECIENLNLVPQMIDDKIEEAFSDEGVEDKVKQVVSEIMLIATNPPAPLKAMVGDDNTDNTVALQALINFATLNNKMLYIPSGTYIVGGVAMKDNVCIFGSGNTVLKLADVSNNSMFIGTVENICFKDITFNGNIDRQTVNTALLSLNSNTLCMEGVKFDSVYTALTLNGSMFGDSIIISEATGTALKITGSGTMLTSVQIKTADKSLILNGEDNYITMMSKAVFEADENNTVICAPLAKQEKFEDSVKEDAMERSEHYNSKTTTAGTISETATTKSETITGTKDVSADTVNENISSEKNVTAHTETHIIEDEYLVKSGKSVETVTNDKTVTAKNIVQTSTESNTLAGKDVKLISTNPVTYRKPLKLNDNYDFVPFTNEETGNTYQVLVYNGTDPTPSEPTGETHLPVFKNVKDLGAKGDSVTDDTEAFNSAVNSGSLVYIPAGTYLVSSLTVPSGCGGFTGDGNLSKIKFSSDNTTITFNGKTALSNLQIEEFSTNNSIICNADIVIYNVTLNCSLRSNSVKCMIDSSFINKNLTLSSAHLQINNSALTEINVSCIDTNDIMLVNNHISELTYADTANTTLIAVNNIVNGGTIPSADNFAELKLSNNVGYADYPPQAKPTPAFDYTVPNNQPLLFKGTAENGNDGSIYNDTNNNLLILKQNEDKTGWKTIGYASPDGKLYIENLTALQNAVFNKDVSISGTANVTNLAVYENASINALGVTNQANAKKFVTNNKFEIAPYDESFTGGALLSGYYTPVGGQETLVQYMFLNPNQGSIDFRQPLVNNDGSGKIKFLSSIDMQNSIFFNDRPHVTSGARWTDTEGRERFALTNNDGGTNLYLWYKDDETNIPWNAAFSVSCLTGEVTFNKNIHAPNIGGSSGTTTLQYSADITVPTSEMLPTGVGLSRSLLGIAEGTTGMLLVWYSGNSTALSKIQLEYTMEDDAGTTLRKTLSSMSNYFMLPVTANLNTFAYLTSTDKSSSRDVHMDVYFMKN